MLKEEHKNLINSLTNSKSQIVQLEDNNASCKNALDEKNVQV